MLFLIVPSRVNTGYTKHYVNVLLLALISNPVP
jgi:hypothetical protein